MNSSGVLQLFLPSRWENVCVCARTCERAAEEIPVEASNSKVEQRVLINKYLFMKKQRENFYTVPHRCRHPCLFAAYTARLVLHQRYNTVRKPYPRGMQLGLIFHKVLIIQFTEVRKVSFKNKQNLILGSTVLKSRNYFFLTLNIQIYKLSLYLLQQDVFVHNPVMFHSPLKLSKSITGKRNNKAIKGRPFIIPGLFHIPNQKVYLFKGRNRTVLVQ